MGLLEENAARVAGHMAEESVVPARVALDPLTVLALLNLLVNVIGRLVQCYGNDHRRMARRVRRPRVLDHLVVHHHAVTCLAGRPGAGAYAMEAAEAVIALGADLTEGQLAGLAAETEVLHGRSAV